MRAMSGNGRASGFVPEIIHVKMRLMLHCCTSLLTASTVIKIGVCIKGAVCANCQNLLNSY